MKKILSISFCLLLIASVFTGCGDGKVSSSGSSSTTSGSSSAASPSPSASPSSSSSSSSDLSEASGDAERELKEFRDTLKESYGEDYIPDRELSAQEISERTGITEDLYDDIYAEGSTLDENPDIFIAVKAKSGKADQVEQLLQKYKENILSDNQFEANQDKIEAAQTMQEGDYVFFFILGKNDFGEEMTDMAQGFKDQMEKGMDALRRMFS